MYYGYFDPVNFVFHAIGWILIAVLIVWLIRGSRRSRHMHRGEMWGQSNHNKAMDLLKERYVKGEINKEEYEEKKKALSE